ncbi:ABC transporter ATP-binding protein [Salmonella enterica subsp. enterica serovar Javiana]|nr:ABC transporter ATP-binding protein [Salmonella enterica subsp. enterica serovar Javiana]
MGGDVETTTDKTPNYLPAKLLMALLGGQKFRLILAVILTMCSALLDLLVFYLLYLAAKYVLVEPQVIAASHLITLAGGLAVTLVAKYLFLVAGGTFSHLAAFRVLYEIRLQLAYSLAKLPLPILGKYSSGGLRNIVLSDVGRLENFIAHYTVDLVVALTTPVMVALFLFWLDWRMACAALCSVPLALIIQMMMSRGMSGAVQHYNQAITALNGAVVEYLRGIPVIKAFRQTSDSFGLLRDRLDAYHRFVIDITRQKIPAWSVFVVVLNANIFVLLPTGSWLWYHGELSMPGFIMAVMLGSGLLKPLLKLLSLSSASRELLDSAGRIGPLLLSTTPQCATEKPVNNAVCIEHLSFGYPSRQVLHAISLDLLPGSFNALVGPSGSGKSTLVAILSGLLPVEHGKVLIGGVVLSALSDSERARTIAVVSQENFMFQGSLAENLRLANPQASVQDLYQALEVAQALALVESLPEGLETPIGEAGIRLSGGERQRLAIARALLIQATVLVLDEATAFADSITEATFYHALRQRYPQMTVLVIAHRLYSVRHADQIMLLEQGKISAKGRHQALISGSKTYETMWHSQFSSQIWQIRQPQERGLC